MNISSKSILCLLGYFVLSTNALEVTRDAPRNTVIDGSYIVELKQKAAKQDVIRLTGDSMVFEYNNVMDGFSVQGISDSDLRNLLDSSDVEAVYEDVRNELYETVQENAPWGLDRIDARTGLDDTYTYKTTASDVTIFIVDSGVLSSHSEFGGRVEGCRDFVGTGCRSPGLHGTHVAATAAGRTFGVAKGAKIVDLKVCTGDGCATSAIIAAMDEIVARKNSGGGKMVANLSLGGPLNVYFNGAVTRAVNAGVTVVVAAGNSNANACLFSPAAASGVITVGSTTNRDARSSFSNYGSCVDVFAPGSSILSASNNGGSTTLSGTSMASPAVAGIAALFLSEGKDAESEIIRQATPSVISNAGSGSPNRLAHTGVDTSPFPAPAPPSDGGGDGFGCFSATSLVSVRGKGRTPMVDLRIGDQILTNKGYESIYAFAHDDHNTRTEFLQLRFSAGVMEVTGEHLIYLSHKRNPIRADSIKVGSSLLTADGKSSIVTGIGKIRKSGLYAPLTPSGTMVVDDHVTSCYVSFFPIGHLEPLGGIVSYHHLAHLGLGVLRIGCSSISPAFCRAFNEDGVLYFVQFGATLFQWVSSLPPLIQNAFTLVYIAILSPMWIAEFILGCALLGYMVVVGNLIWWFKSRKGWTAVRNGGMK